LLAESRPVEVVLGSNVRFPAAGMQLQAGTGFFEKSWQGKEIKPGLGTITVKNPNNGLAYGAVYWQYFEDLNKVSRQATGISIKKALFKQVSTTSGKQWLEVSGKTLLHPGDRVMVRLVIQSARAVDYVAVEDMRAAAFEPETLLSAYRYTGGLYYYEEVKDAVTRFFIRHLPKGTFVMEYPLLVTQKGTFTNGMARIQSLYLPSFAAHSSGRKIKVQ
jgi:uncharacterized protein YfaS (alpha-2-macroglobulin family)